MPHKMVRMSSYTSNQHLRFNFIVNVLDGSFFGFALGIASFVTIIPLFVASLTDSTILIGLIASIHLVGWQLPQLLMAGRVSRLRLYRPMVLLMTIHERWPFLGLALIAFLVPIIGRDLALIFTFVMLIWQALGGGLTATAWQSMISKVMPPQRRGTFYGVQSSAANLMGSLGSVLAGALLTAFSYPSNYGVIFGLAAIAMGISWGFLSATREEEREVVQASVSMHWRAQFHQMKAILHQDRNFIWFIVVRFLMQFATMGMAFYTIYAVRFFGMDGQTAGFMTGWMMLAQTFASPIAGWAGDRWGHRRVLLGGGVFTVLSVLLAMSAQNISWFYVVFALSGAVQAVLWTTILAITVEFGPETQRPFYIGLSNTLVAPATLFAPILGGWLADFIGFQATFGLCLIAGIAAIGVLQFILIDPSRSAKRLSTASA